MIVKFVQVFEPVKNARCVEIADVSVAERNFVKPDILWRSDKDAFAGQVRVIVVTRDLCVLSVV